MQPEWRRTLSDAVTRHTLQCKDGPHHALPMQQEWRRLTDAMTRRTLQIHMGPTTLFRAHASHARQPLVKLELVHYEVNSNPARATKQPPQNVANST